MIEYISNHQEIFCLIAISLIILLVTISIKIATSNHKKYIEKIKERDLLKKEIIKLEKIKGLGIEILRLQKLRKEIPFNCEITNKLEKLYSEIEKLKSE
jgi:hypothetical protein